jgi:hypothetical protein
MMVEAARRDWLAESSYLREQAQRCVRLARDCPHRPTSHELEAIGIELMERASELDELFSIEPADTTRLQPQTTMKQK